MAKIRTKHLHIPIYNDVYTVVYATHSEASIFMKNHYGIDIDQDYDGITIELKNEITSDVIRVVLITKIKKQSNAKRAEIIAHEAYHMTCKTLKRAGVRFSDESEEAFAYLLGYITRELMEFCGEAK